MGAASLGCVEWENIQPTYPTVIDKANRESEVHSQVQKYNHYLSFGG